MQTPGASVTTRKSLTFVGIAMIDDDHVTLFTARKREKAMSTRV